MAQEKQESLACSQWKIIRMQMIIPLACRLLVNKTLNRVLNAGPTPETSQPKPDYGAMLHP